MEIRHNAALTRFETGPAPEPAVCEYRREGTTWVLPHTYVPEPMRGGGVAGALVKAALDHIRTEGGTVVPACSYVAAYIQRHPAYTSLIKPGSG